jgi:hypothetical protein
MWIENMRYPLPCDSICAKLFFIILVSACQCSSSTSSSMDKMKDAEASSVRQAKHQTDKFENLE